MPFHEQRVPPPLSGPRGPRSPHKALTSLSLWPTHLRHSRAALSKGSAWANTRNSHWGNPNPEKMAQSPIFPLSEAGTFSSSSPPSRRNCEQQQRWPGLEFSDMNPRGISRLGRRHTTLTSKRMRRKTTNLHWSFFRGNHFCLLVGRRCKFVDSGEGRVRFFLGVGGRKRSKLFKVQGSPPGFSLPSNRHLPSRVKNAQPRWRSLTDNAVKHADETRAAQ